MLGRRGSTEDEDSELTARVRERLTSVLPKSEVISEHDELPEGSCRV